MIVTLDAVQKKEMFMEQSTLNILLTEDNEDDLELTLNFLKKLDHSYCLDHASTGEECLDKLLKKEYHLLLLDYQMPGRDGLSILKEIRDKNFDLPVIMVTGQGSERIAAEAIKNGAQDYIVKAGDYFKTLPIVIKNAIEKHKLLEEKEALEKEVRFEKEKFKLIFENMGDGVCMVDANHNTLLFNKQSEKFFETISTGSKCYEAIKGATEPCADCLIGIKLPVGSSRHFEISIKNQRTLMVTFTPFHGLDGKRVYLEVFKDITERKESEKRLYIASITDSLTGLFNQGHFYSELKKEMNRSRRNQRPLSLILLDVDKFKEYNDEYGHQEGDKVLKTIGDVVKKEIREEIDLAFRYGGDEFTIILPEANLSQAKSIAERIRVSFIAYNFTTLSIGVIESGAGVDLKTLIKNADLAMYKAKKSGGNCLSNGNK